MSNYKGLFIGLTTIDIQYLIEEFPQPNIKTKSEPPEILVGGPAANAAVAFAKLNGNASFVSAVGKNSFTDFVTNDFKQTGIDFIDLMDGEYFSPVLATVVTSKKNGDRNIFTHYPKTINIKTDCEHLIDSICPQIIMLDGFYPEIGIPCAQIAKKKNIPVVLDCGSWKPQYEKLLDFSDFVICSEKFFPQNTVNSQQVLVYLKQKNIQYFAISRGEKSILFQDKNKAGEIEIIHPKIIDTLGAGDILHGAFCYYYLQYRDFKTALKKASEIATFSCSFKGTRQWLNFF